MPKFKYEAMDTKGKETKGVLEVGSQAEAISRLKEMGFLPTKVVEAGQLRDALVVGPGVGGKLRVHGPGACACKQARGRQHHLHAGHEGARGSRFGHAPGGDGGTVGDADGPARGQDVVIVEEGARQALVPAGAISSPTVPSSGSAPRPPALVFWAMRANA
mgnify:CR=1 FL=1